MTEPETIPAADVALPESGPDDGIVVRPPTTADAPGPAMLLVGPPDTIGDNEGDGVAPPLLDALQAALVAAGVTVVRPHDDSWHDADDASAPVEAAVRLLEWMQADPAIDNDRIGALGYGHGAIVVSCTAGARGVNRVVLVAPTAPDCARAKGAEETADDGRCPALLSSVGVSSAAAPLSRHTHPVLIVSGSADRIAPPEAADAWIAALEHAERMAGHEQVGRADHAFADPDHRTAIVSRVTAFAGAMQAPVRAAGAA